MGYRESAEQKAEIKTKGTVASVLYQAKSLLATLVSRGKGGRAELKPSPEPGGECTTIRQRYDQVFRTAVP